MKYKGCVRCEAAGKLCQTHRRTFEKSLRTIAPKIAACIDCGGLVSNGFNICPPCYKQRERERSRINYQKQKANRVVQVREVYTCRKCDGPVKMRGKLFKTDGLCYRCRALTCVSCGGKKGGTSGARCDSCRRSDNDAKMIKACQSCGVQFRKRRGKSEPGKFCSWRCSADSKRVAIRSHELKKRINSVRCLIWPSQCVGCQFPVVSRNSRPAKCAACTAKPPSTIRTCVVCASTFVRQVNGNNILDAQEAL